MNRTTILLALAVMIAVGYYLISDSDSPAEPPGHGTDGTAEIDSQVDPDSTDRDHEAAATDTTNGPPLTDYQRRIFDAVPGLLFSLDRTTNANIVVYQANATDSTWQTAGVSNEWIMLEKLSDKTQIAQAGREAVTLFEQSGYGFEVRPGPDADTKNIVLTPVPERPIVLKYNEELQRPIACIKLNGQDARLVQISVDVTSGFIPSVNHVDLIGYDLKNLEPLSERITK